MEKEDIIAAVQNDPTYIRDLKNIDKTYEVCLEAVRIDAYGAFPYVPDVYKTPELSSLAVSLRGELLTHVQFENRTPEICLTAVKQDGHALLYVPDVYKSYEICLAAVSENGLAFSKVPVEHRTFELWLIALKQHAACTESMMRNKMCDIFFKYTANNYQELISLCPDHPEL